jgi:hypothetical protein
VPSSQSAVTAAALLAAASQSRETVAPRAKQQRVPLRATFACRPVRRRRDGRDGATVLPVIEMGAKETRMETDPQALADAMRDGRNEWSTRE